MSAIDTALRLVGAFYVLAGIVLARATLTSHVADRALAALTLERTAPAERVRVLWSLALAILVYASGIALAALLDWALWLFLAAAGAQAVYLTFAEAPSLEGRRQSINAFFIYAGATLLVLWAYSAGRLTGWPEASTPAKALAGAAFFVFLLYILRHYRVPRTVGPR